MEAGMIRDMYSMFASDAVAASASVSSVLKFLFTQSAREPWTTRRRRSASTLLKKARASSTVGPAETAAAAEPTAEPTGVLDATGAGGAPASLPQEAAPATVAAIAKARAEREREGRRMASFYTAEGAERTPICVRCEWDIHDPSFGTWAFDSDITADGTPTA